MSAKWAATEHASTLPQTEPEYMRELFMMPIKRPHRKRQSFVTKTNLTGNVIIKFMFNDSFKLRVLHLIKSRETYKFAKRGTQCCIRWKRLHFIYFYVNDYLINREEEWSLLTKATNKKRSRLCCTHHSLGLHHLEAVEVRHGCPLQREPENDKSGTSPESSSWRKNGLIDIHVGMNSGKNKQEHWIYSSELSGKYK